MYLMLCVYACLEDTINSTCGYAWWGREMSGGEGRDTLIAIESYAELQEEGAVNANTCHLPISIVLLCPLLPYAFLVALQ